MSEEKKKRIRTALFGGTFDPWTPAHEAMVEMVLEKDLVDRVIVVPTIVDYYRAGKGNASLFRFREREEIIRRRVELSSYKDRILVDTRDYDLAEKMYSNARSNLENSSGEKYDFTPGLMSKAVCSSRRFIHTLIEIRNEIPKDTMYIMFGTDHMDGINSWFCIDEISGLVHSAIAFNGRCGATKEKHWMVSDVLELPGKYAGVSATKIREHYGPRCSVDKYLSEWDSLLEEEDDLLLHTPIFDVVKAGEVMPGFRPVKVCAPDWVAMMVIDGDGAGGDLVLSVNQLRYGSMKMLDELPCGQVEKGEEPLAAAVRELSEETGLEFYKEDLVHLGSMSPNPAFMTNKMHFFFVDVTTLKHAPKSVGQDLDEHERLSVKWMKLADFEKSVVSDEGSSMMATALFLAKRKGLVK